MTTGEKLYPPIHPGEILMEDFIKGLGITQHDLAVSLSVPPPRIYEIVHGRRDITADIAARLARYFGTSEEFWINLQVCYDQQLATERNERQNRRDRDARRSGATDLDGVAGSIEVAKAGAGHPIVVGISGFGGSGKSSLAASLAGALTGAAQVRGDDFLNPMLSHRRSSDWAGVERLRLADEVLCPFREGRTAMFRPFDWGTRSLGSPQPVPRGDILLVDMIGLLHPELDGLLDLAIWCDVDITTATSWGKARDARLGRSHDQLWDEVWVPNERDFLRRFAPRCRADLVLPPLPLNEFADN